MFVCFMIRRLGAENLFASLVRDGEVGMGMSVNGCGVRYLHTVMLEC